MQFSMTQKRKPSEAETAILKVLWQDEPCTVRNIHARISATKDVGYTTTLKQVQRLLDKGLLAREPGPGKSYLYRTTASEEETKTRLFDRFVETAFGNSVSDLVMHALGNGEPTEDEIREIRAFLNQIDQK